MNDAKVGGYAFQAKESVEIDMDKDFSDACCLCL